MLHKPAIGKVTPAKAGASQKLIPHFLEEIPAFAGMTVLIIGYAIAPSPINLMLHHR